MSQTRDNLLTVLKTLHGFELEVPFTGLSGRRRWRFDAALTDGRRVALEYQGIGRGHQWHKEQAKDHEKQSEAALCGWTLIVCDAELVNNGKCLQFVEMALRGETDTL
jgi:hypothetical protein